MAVFDRLLRTGEGKKLRALAGLVPEINALEPEMHALSDGELAAKSDEYACDITYGTNNEFGFDYLRDNMAMSRAGQVQRGHNFAIVDEVDSILIDEARTPLIISGRVADAAQLYYKFASVVRGLTR